MTKRKYNLIRVRRTHKKCISNTPTTKPLDNQHLGQQSMPFQKFYNTFFRFITFKLIKFIQSALICVRVLFFIYPSWLTIRKYLAIFPGTIYSKCPGDEKEHPRRQVKRQLAGRSGCSCIFTTSMRFFSSEKLKKGFRMRLPERLLKRVNLGLFRVLFFDITKQLNYGTLSLGISTINKEFFYKSLIIKHLKNSLFWADFTLFEWGKKWEKTIRNLVLKYILSA